VPALDSGVGAAVQTKRLKPDGSNAIVLGTAPSTAAEAGVFTKSLGGNYQGFAYGLFGTAWNCDNWPNVSQHWRVGASSYDWEPSATQIWAGAVNGSASVWLR